MALLGQRLLASMLQERHAWSAIETALRKSNRS